MYGFFAAFGSAARRFTRGTLATGADRIAPSHLAFFHEGEAVTAAVFTPTASSAGPTATWSVSRKLGVAMDGYCVTDVPHSGSHLHHVLRQLETGSITDALGSIVSGSFNLLILDPASARYTVANDRWGSIPLYYATLADGCLVSTHPSLLSTSGLIAGDIDRTACAELAYIGYTIGERHFLKAIRLLPPASLLTWDAKAKQCAISRTALNPLGAVPTSDGLDLAEIAARVRTACRRLSRIGGRTAHLQSGGMDSRLILAAWPKEEPLSCYTYGHPRLAEVAVARSIAEARGAPFTHVTPDGDAVAASLDEMFRLNGPHIFPSRYLTAKVISADGFDNVLDGFMGEVLLGGRYFSRTSRYGRMTQTFTDQKISKVGLDAITEMLLHEIFDVEAEAFFNTGVLNHDVAHALGDEKPNIREDIYRELKQWLPPNDSVGLLIRNFKIANRSLHALLHQGVMCRRFLRVLYPLADFGLSEALLDLRPRHTVHAKLYIDLFRRHFPAYAELRYAASMLPLKRPPLIHHWSKTLRKRGIHVPFLTARVGSLMHVNHWDQWFKESSMLRAKTVALLADSGLGDSDTVASKMDEIARDRLTGYGDLLNLAGLGSLSPTPALLLGHQR